MPTGRARCLDWPVVSSSSPSSPARQVTRPTRPPAGSAPDPDELQRAQENAVVALLDVPAVADEAERGDGRD